MVLKFNKHGKKVVESYPEFILKPVREIWYEKYGEEKFSSKIEGIITFLACCSLTDKKGGFRVKKHEDIDEFIRDNMDYFLELTMNYLRRVTAN